MRKSITNIVMFTGLTSTMFAINIIFFRTVSILFADMSKNDKFLYQFDSFHKMYFPDTKFSQFWRMHIDDADLISVGPHIKTVKQIAGIWLDKPARMVTVFSVTHRKNIFLSAQASEYTISFVFVEHTYHSDVRVVVGIRLTYGFTVRK